MIQALIAGETDPVKLARWQIGGSGLQPRNCTSDTRAPGA
jgi:hypothetical protein